MGFLKGIVDFAVVAAKQFRKEITCFIVVVRRFLKEIADFVVAASPFPKNPVILLLWPGHF